MGYSINYTHEVTEMDFTNYFDGYTDEQINEQGWIITDIKDIDEKAKEIDLYINTKENIDRLQNKKSQEETLMKNFDPAVAMASLEQYGKDMYGSSFKLHMIIGVIAETAVDENTWFMKYKCQYKDKNGTKVEKTCEGKIKGPEDNPTVYDFSVY